MCANQNVVPSRLRTSRADSWPSLPPGARPAASGCGCLSGVAGKNWPHSRGRAGRWRLGGRSGVPSDTRANQQNIRAQRKVSCGFSTVIVAQQKGASCKGMRGAPFGSVLPLCKWKQDVELVSVPRSSSRRQAGDCAPQLGLAHGLGRDKDLRKGAAGRWCEPGAMADVRAGIVSDQTPRPRRPAVRWCVVTVE